MGEERAVSRPWYREPWPWLLMAGPAAVVLAGMATLYLALRSDDGLVADDYYKRGLAINATLAREGRARALGVSASLELLPRRDGVRVRLAGSIGNPARLRLRLVHPTRTGRDQSTVLVALPGGAYGSPIQPLEPGTWRVLLDDDVSGWRISGLLQPGEQVVALQPPPER